MASAETAEALEKEVAEDRARVEETINAIQRKLTPGQMIDELVSLTQESGSGLAASLGSAIRANPLPAALVGVGILWLILAQARPPADTKVPPAKPEA